MRVVRCSNGPIHSAVGCCARRRIESERRFRRHGREQPPTPAQVVGHRREPDLQACLGRAKPAHPAQAVGRLGCAERLPDACPHTPYLGVVRLQPRERLHAAAVQLARDGLEQRQVMPHRHQQHPEQRQRPPTRLALWPTQRCPPAGSPPPPSLSAQTFRPAMRHPKAPDHQRPAVPAQSADRPCSTPPDQDSMESERTAPDQAIRAQVS